MVRQYPYSLWVFQTPEAVQDEETGNWSSPEGEWVEFSKCRDESNARGRRIQTDDGTYHQYEYLVQLPKSCPNVAAGAKLEVRDGTTVRVSATAIRFSKDQLHCRLWV